MSFTLPALISSYRRSRVRRASASSFEVSGKGILHQFIRRAPGILQPLLNGRLQLGIRDPHFHFPTLTAGDDSLVDAAITLAIVIGRTLKSGGAHQEPERSQPEVDARSLRTADQPSHPAARKARRGGKDGHPGRSRANPSLGTRAVHIMTTGMNEAS
jgi:hypothetical protein